MQNLLNNTLQKVSSEQNYIEISNPPTSKEVLKNVTLGLGIKVDSPEEARLILREKNILTEELQPYFSENNRQPMAAEVIMLIANLYKFLEDR